MQFERVSPECLVAKCVKAEDLLSLLNFLGGVFDNRIPFCALRTNGAERLIAVMRTINKAATVTSICM